MEKFNKTSLSKFSKDYSKYLKELLDNLDHNSIENIFEILDKARKRKNKIFIIGNGGSGKYCKSYL
jgi:DNA-binding MurR/RpiR family transcriptional regulator